MRRQNRRDVYIMDNVCSGNKMAVSVAEAADLLGLSRPTVYQLTHRADFPAVRVGGRVLVPVNGLRAWLDQQAQNSREE